MSFYNTNCYLHIANAPNIKFLELAMHCDQNITLITLFRKCDLRFNMKGYAYIDKCESH